MRIVCIAQADIAAVATMLVGKLTELLNELCKVCCRPCSILRQQVYDHGV
jgi:hypothetical protein